MQFFDVITALTISGILAILVLYILVVYKKGWLKRNSIESHFLCPNLKCKKIFTEPVWLTDLSRTPPESYPACPHCGINLNVIPFFNAPKSHAVKSAHETAPSLKEFKRPIGRMQPIQTQTTTEESDVIEEVAESDFPIEVSQSSKKSAGSANAKSLVHFLEDDNEPSSKSVEKPRMEVEKKPSPGSRECPHSFGYVRSLPKNTPIPDECLGCSWLVECLTQAAKAEA